MTDLFCVSGTSPTAARATNCPAKAPLAPALIVDPRWPHDLLDPRAPYFVVDLKTYICQCGFGDGGASPEHLILKFGERPSFEHVPLLIPATIPGIVFAHPSGLEWNREPVSNAPFRVGLGFVGKYRGHVLQLKKYPPLPAGDVHWLPQAYVGRASKALHWSRPADAKPGDPLYAPPADLSPEEQITWCKRNWQPVWLSEAPSVGMLRSFRSLGRHR